jgi:hypothetical protein
MSVLLHRALVAPTAVYAGFWLVAAVTSGLVVHGHRNRRTHR